MTFLSLSTAKTALFAVDVTFYGTSTAVEGDCQEGKTSNILDEASGFGIRETADAGDLVDVGAETESDLTHEF